MIPLPWWLRLVIWLGTIFGLAVWILAGRCIATWWRDSITVRCLRWRLADMRAATARPFRVLRRRSSQLTAGVGASPTPAPAVPQPAEMSHDTDQ